MASPLHAAYPEARGSRPRQAHSHADAPHSPLHLASVTRHDAPSPSRQTRRLQLRNAGFRGPSLPSREGTSGLQSSTSTNWSSGSGLAHSSDVENVSPLSGKRTEASTTTVACLSNLRDSPGGILQDIGNASPAASRQANSKRARTRATSNQPWRASQDFGSWTTLPQDELDMSLQQAAGARPRSLRISRAKTGRPHRSVSGETRRYVDHLEQQLSEAQSQLSAMTSPTVTREQSSKMRHLNAETKQLQEEVAAWEAKYEERVREEMDKHYQVEISLRARVRNLEDEAETSTCRVQELEAELESTKMNTEAVESANVNLERRLELLSELLAASPTKIDLHAPAPGRPRQSRPHSMLPRFPTAGSLASSPERSFSRAHAASPSASSLRFSPAGPLSPSNLTFSPEVASDDDECSYSDMHSVIVAPPTAKRPMRRMRRFGAGSIGPKPLILPSTSHCDQIPASAPPFDRGDSQGAFPFSSRFDSTFHDPAVEDRNVESRVLSAATPELFPEVLASPTTNFESSGNDDVLLEDTLDFESAPRRISRATTAQDRSSIGSKAGELIGRNLMEELTAVRSNEDTLSDTEHTDETQVHVSHNGISGSSPFESDREEHCPLSLSDIPNGTGVTPPEVMTARFASGTSTALAPSTAYGTLRLSKPPYLRSRASSMSLGVRSIPSMSALDSLRKIFSNLFRSPVELAKHLVQTAQTRMMIPRPLLTVQWWLVGVLLGPMVRRRMLGKAQQCCQGLTADHRMDPAGSDHETDNAIAYGESYQTPKSSPPQSQARSLVAGKGKKRTPSPFSDHSSAGSPCPHHSKHYKHSPWLWLKFSMTLALAVGVAFKDGPSSLLKDSICRCRKSGRRLSNIARHANWRDAGRDDSLLVTPGSLGSHEATGIGT